MIDKATGDRVLLHYPMLQGLPAAELDDLLAAALMAKSSPIRITHQALADELGSLREIVTRLLKTFADNGWLRLGREQIEILDEAGLRKFVAL